MVDVVEAGASFLPVDVTDRLRLAAAWDAKAASRSFPLAVIDAVLVAAVRAASMDDTAFNATDAGADETADVSSLFEPGRVGRAWMAESFKVTEEPLRATSVDLRQFSKKKRKKRKSASSIGKLHSSHSNRQLTKKQKQ